ncbi:MAG TPA: hypothetical protein VG276_07075 [Actinomycetes bacterium]|nr:hypothetical protein [Actinomycetes bacterium]
MREVEAVAGADLDDAAGQAGEQLPPVLGDAGLGVREVADPGIAAGEDGMADRSGLAAGGHGHPSHLLG